MGCIQGTTIVNPVKKFLFGNPVHHKFIFSQRLSLPLKPLDATFNTPRNLIDDFEYLSVLIRCKTNFFC